MYAKIQEMLKRPTARADWWESPHSHVLAGRDLQRDERGTWLGVTSDGRIATLTNFREAGPPVVGKVSRGAMANAWLKQAPGAVADTEEFARSLVSGEGSRGSGGFTLVFGRLGEPLAVVSNRMTAPDQIAWIGEERGQTVGLSNAAFGAKDWSKVSDGERLLACIIEDHASRDDIDNDARDKPTTGTDEDRKQELIRDLFGLLSRNTMQELRGNEDAETVTDHFRSSIFVPVVGRSSSGSAVGGAGAGGGGQQIQTGAVEAASNDASAAISTTGVANNTAATMNMADPSHAQAQWQDLYGTSKQTVILLDHEHNVTMVERTLYENCQPVNKSDASRSFHFKIKS